MADDKKDIICRQDISADTCNGVQRGHNKKLNHGLPILQSTAQTRLRAVFLYLGGERRNYPRGLTEKLSPFFTPKNRR